MASKMVWEFLYYNVKWQFFLLKCLNSLKLSKGVITKAFAQVFEKIQSELMGDMAVNEY